MSYRIIKRVLIFIDREIAKLNLMLKKTPILLNMYDYYAQSYSLAFLMQFLHSLNTTETIASLHTFYSKKSQDN